jgi:thiosulfate dehydrogenase
MRYLYLALFALVSGCDPEPVVVTLSAAEYGEKLFSDPALSDAASNRVSCTDCHSTTLETSFLSGGSLKGVTKRPSYWGGAEIDLLRSINHCRYYFMAANVYWTGDEDEAVATYAFLESISQDEEGAAPQPFELGEVKDPKPGDAARGSKVFDAACRSCHGAPSSGLGAIVPSADRLPQDTLAAHPEPEYSDEDRRLVFVEKTRHGGFLGYGGTMPPFSLNVLSDEDLADLLTFLRLP